MRWNETTTEYSSYNFRINEETLKLVDTDNNSELLGGDLVRGCEDCDSEELYEVRISDEAELRKIVEMENEERLEWLEKYKTMEKLKEK